MDDFLNTFGPGRMIGIPQILFACLLTFVMSSVIASTYRKTYQGMSFSRSFIHALILGAISSCVVIMAIGNNLARGLGILGTLALVRFRTPIRDPRDIIFLFAALGVGIACGAAVFPVAVFGTIFFCAAALYLHYSPLASRRQYEGLLRFVAPAKTQHEPDIIDVLKTYCESFQLIAMREAAQGALLEHAYHVRLVDPTYQADLVDKLREIEGVSNASLLMQRSTIEL